MSNKPIKIDEEPFEFFRKYKNPIDFDDHDPYKIPPELKDWDGKGETIGYKEGPNNLFQDHYFSDDFHSTNFEGTYIAFNM